MNAAAADTVMLEGAFEDDPIAAGRSEESTEKPLIILDLEDHAGKSESDGSVKLVQSMLKELMIEIPDEDHRKAVGGEDSGELTDFEREVLSKYMLEMREQEICDKPDGGFCHLTATDRLQERDPMKVIGFSQPAMKSPADEEGAHDIDRLNNNNETSDAARVDENANQFRIAVSKQDDRPPVQQATSNCAETAAGGQQPPTAVAPTPKVTSSPSITTTDNSANITPPPPLANNLSSNIINCTAIPSTTSTTVATITAVSTNTSASEDLDSHRQKQQQQQQQQLILEEEQKAQKQRSRAMRRNFSVWVGVTSCVWGILIYLIKSYTSL